PIDLDVGLPVGGDEEPALDAENHAGAPASPINAAEVAQAAPAQQPAQYTGMIAGVEFSGGPCPPCQKRKDYEAGDCFPKRPANGRIRGEECCMPCSIKHCGTKCRDFPLWDAFGAVVEKGPYDAAVQAWKAKYPPFTRAKRGSPERSVSVASSAADDQEEEGSAAAPSESTGKRALPDRNARPKNLVDQAKQAVVADKRQDKRQRLPTIPEGHSAASDSGESEDSIDHEVVEHHKDLAREGELGVLIEALNTDVSFSQESRQEARRVAF
ncbi:hypothetical protein EMMF5_006591, partial [Cystobasidiomycetes sp. EMM_F5]